MVHPNTNSSTSTILKRRRSSTSLSASPSSSHVISSISCSHCGTDTTPLWRRAPNGDTICNACGLYLKTKHTMRPLSSISTIHPTKQKVESACKDTGDDQEVCSTNEQKQTGGSCGGAGQCNGLGGSAACAGCPTFNNQHLRKQEQQTELMVCSNCRVSMTPLWRRDDQGNTICNACGLYYKLHKVHRPVSMKRNVIKRRKRVILLENQQQKSSLQEMGHNNATSPPLTTIKKNCEQQDSIHNNNNNKSIPAIEDCVNPARFPIRQQQAHQFIPNRPSLFERNTQHIPLHHHLPSFPMDSPLDSSSRISLPPIQSLSTPPSPPLSISSLLSTSSSSAAASSPSSTSHTLSGLIQRLDHLNKKITSGQQCHHSQHHLPPFITQLDQLISVAESTLLSSHKN